MGANNNLKKLLLNTSKNYFEIFKQAITFLPEFYSSSGKTSSLLNITFEITRRCNMSCTICPYKEHNWTKENVKELDAGQIRQLANQAARSRASFFLSGGEPFVREDILEVLKTIKEHGLNCGIITNGTLLNKEKIITLIELGLDYIIFSFHGTGAVHNRIVGHEGSFEKSVENLQLFSKFRKNSNKLYINCTISAESINSLPEIVFLGKEHKVDAVLYQHLSFLDKNDIERFAPIKRELMKNASLEFLLSCHSFDQPLDLLYEKTEEVMKTANQNKVNVIFKPYLNRRGIANWYGKEFASTKKCVYPWLAMRIGPNGDAFLCPNVLMKVGNVLETDINQLVNNDSSRLFRKTLRKEGGKFPVCARCCKLYMSPFGKV